MLPTWSGEWLSCGPSFGSISGHLHLQSHQRFTGKRSLYICFSPFTVRSHSPHTEIFISTSISFALASIVCRDISKFQEKWVSRLGVNPCISLIRASLQHLNDAFKWRAIGIIIISSVSHSFVPSVFLNFRSESDNFHQPSTYKCVSPDLNWWRLSSHLQITII